jgi:hypothetical protein
VDIQSSSEPAMLWLCQLPGITSATVQKLLAAFGSAEAIMRQPASQLRTYGIPSPLVARIIAGPREVTRVAAGLKGLQRLGIKPIPMLTPEYPQCLLQLPDPPLVLYIQGAWPPPKPLVLVVGPPRLDEHTAIAWNTITANLQRLAYIATLEHEGAPNLPPPRLLGTPFGLLLARQRLSQLILASVANGTTTLISTNSPTAPPDPMYRSCHIDLLTALADAIIMVTPEVQDWDATARRIGIPIFAFATTPRTALPPRVRRLSPGATGMRKLWQTLGVHEHEGSIIHQERLL